MEDITLNIGLKPGDIQSTAEKLRKEIERIFKSTSGDKTSVKFKQLQQQMAKAYEQSKLLQSKMRSLERIRTPNYQVFQNQLVDVQEKANRLLNTIERMQKAGKASGAEYNRLVKEWTRLNNEAERIKQKMKEMRDNGTAFTSGVNTEEYKKLAQQLNDVNNKLIVLKQKAYESGEVSASKFGLLSTVFERLKSTIGAAIPAIVSAVRQLPSIFQSVGSSFSQMWGNSLLASSMFLNAIDAVKDKLTSAVTSVQGFGQKLLNLGPTIKSGVSDALTRLGNIADGVKNKMTAFGSIIASAVSDPLYTLDRVAGFAITAIGTLSAKLATLAASGIKGILIGAATGAVALAKGLAGAAKNLAKFTIEKAKNGLKSFADRAKDAAENLKKMVGQGIVAGIKKLGSALLGLNKNTKASNNALEIGFKTLIRYGLGMRSVFFLVKRLRAQLIEGFGNLTQYSEPFNQTVSAFLSSLYTLKNAFAAAFAPIVSVVTPILTYFLNLLNAVIAKVGEFLYALTGQKMYITAKKVQVDYAKSLDKSADSTDKASKATKKNTKATEEYQKTIAGFDDVEILKGPDKDNDADTSGAGAGSGAGAVSPTGADMFETKPISTAVSEFANKIRDFIKRQDWTGLGTFLGQQINSIFAKAQKLISWENLGNKITKIVTAITKTLNALVKAVDWGLIGKTFATGINTIIYTINLLLNGIDWYAIGNAFATGLNGLISNIDWASLGTTLGVYINAWIHTIQGFVENFDWIGTAVSLATGLNNLVRTIDWASAGSMLSTGITGALNFLTYAVATFNWQELGQNIAKFVGSIDWSGVTAALFSALGAVLGGLGAFLWGLIEDAWQGVVTYWTQAAFQGGQFSMQGLLQGILNGLANLGQWIYNNIFTPFINGFKKAFRISSPSKVMEEQGNFIVDGLFNGLSNQWHTITTFITDKISEIKDFFFNGGWRDVGDDVLTKLHDSITDFASWDDITSTVSDAVSDIKGYFEDTDWSDIGSNILDGIGDGIDYGWRWLSEKVADVADDLLEAAKRQLGIASPSKVFRDTVGKMIPAGLAEGVMDDQNLAVKAVVSMSDAVQDGAVKNLQIPAVVTGEVVPFTSKYSNQDEANNALNKIIDMLQYNQDENISLDDLREVLIDVIRDYLNINFSIGDEQLARHVNKGNERLDRRFSSTKLSFTRG